MPLAAHHTPAPACPRVVAASRVEDSPWCARVFLRAAGSWTTPDIAPCHATALRRSSRRTAWRRSSTCSAAGAARLRGSTWSCTPGRVPRLPGLYPGADAPGVHPSPQSHHTVAGERLVEANYALEHAVCENVRSCSTPAWTQSHALYSRGGERPGEWSSQGVVVPISASPPALGLKRSRNRWE